jgi:hypothetical protein
MSAVVKPKSPKSSQSVKALLGIAALASRASINRALAGFDHATLPPLLVLLVTDAAFFHVVTAKIYPPTV